MTFTVWIHWAWQVRPCLRRAAFQNDAVKWTETGWLRRTYRVEAPQKVVEAIEADCRELGIPIVKRHSIGAEQ